MVVGAVLQAISWLKLQQQQRNGIPNLFNSNIVESAINFSFHYDNADIKAGNNQKKTVNTHTGLHTISISLSFPFMWSKLQTKITSIIPTCYIVNKQSLLYISESQKSSLSNLLWSFQDLLSYVIYRNNRDYSVKRHSPLLLHTLCQQPHLPVVLR